MTRGTAKRSRWTVEVTAWSVAVVLLAGVVVVVSGVIGTKATSAVADTPVLKQTTPVATLAPRPQPTRQAPVQSRARTGVPVEASLGPPPGPQYDPAPARRAAPEDRYAFLVGVTKYKRPTHDTIAGANDAVFIRSFLIANGWLPENIQVLTDRQATGSAMRTGLRWLASKSTPGTFTLFHYSGHVKQAGGHEKLWPYDRAFIPDNELSSILGPTTGKMWIDVAGCESGGFIEDLPSSRVLVTASSKPTQKSYEYPAWGESVWAGLLWDLSLAQGQADADDNGVTTVGEAIRFSAYYAQAITLRQRPYGRQTPQARGDNTRGWTLDSPPA